MELGPEDRTVARPENVLCFSCHREVPTGKYIHGPAALWNCLVCHDPDQRPVRYQFGTTDPWKITRSIEPASPAVFTISNSALFLPGSATLLSEAVPPKSKDRAAEVRKHKEQERALFQPVLEHLQRNPGEKVLIEAHVDRTSPLSKGKLRTPYLITTARARALEKLLRTYGVSGARRVTAKGMGISLPKGRSASTQDRELNDRIELVAHPPDITVPNSQRLPSFADRERVTVTLGYAGSASSLGDIKVIESLPAGAAYVRGTGTMHGAAREPRSQGNELEWSIGRLEGPSQVRITYMIRLADREAATAPRSTTVRFSEAGQARVRQFGGEGTGPAPAGANVQKVCATCHGSMATGPFTHGPVAAGYCTLCHDPHGSNYSAWTRKESWNLCTTCHAEKKEDKHLIRGRGSNVFHPTRKRPDPLRPGKALACESCHSPHSAYTQELLVLEAKGTFDLCRLCHRQK
jgi:predicted CXXCH cytochrome family protein